MKNNSFNDLNGKVCLITGGAGVIGTAMTEALASVGVKTAILDLRKETAMELAASLKQKYGTDAIGVEGNVLDKESLERVKAEVISQFGRIDILINGAGGNSPDATTKAEQMEPAGRTSRDGAADGGGDPGGSPGARGARGAAPRDGEVRPGDGGRPRAGPHIEGPGAADADGGGPEGIREQ